MFCPSCGKKNEDVADKCITCNAILAVKVIELSNQNKTADDDPYSTNLSIPSGNLANANVLTPATYETKEIPTARMQEILAQEAEKKARQISKAKHKPKEDKNNSTEKVNWQLNLSIQWLLFVITLLMSLLLVTQILKHPLESLLGTEDLIKQHLFSQVTGFVALFFIFFQILLTIRKRWNLPSKLSFNWLRGIHIIGGFSLIIVVLVHTGASWKWNFNGVLLILFLFMSIQASIGNTLEVRLTRRMILRRLANKYKGNTGSIEKERVTKAVLFYLEKTAQNEDVSREKAKEQAKQLLSDFFAVISDIKLMWAEMQLKRQITKKKHTLEEGALTTQLSNLAASRFWAQISKNKRPTAVQLMKILWSGLHIILVSSFLVLLFFHILSTYYF